MRLSRSFWFCTAAVLVAALLLLLWRIRTVTTARSVKLPDSRVLAIEAVTFGTEHRFLYGSLWSRMTASLLPTKWKGKTGAQNYVVPSQTPSLMIWGRWQLPRTGGNPAPWAEIGADSEEARLTGLSGSWIGVPRQGELIMGWNVKNFPRRTKTIRFDVCEFTNFAFKAVAVFQLPNPARRKYPVWEPQKFPIIHERDSLQLEIANFCKGVFLDEPWVSSMGRPLRHTGYVAVAQVKQGGRILDNWQVEQVSVADATGNRIEPRVPASLRIGNYVLFGVQTEREPLWPSEKSWKLTPQFTRTSGFASNELLSIPPMPVPQPGGATQIVFSAEANGLSLWGLEAKRVGGGSFWPQPINQNLEIEPLLSQPRTDRHISLFEVTDNHGRRLRHDRSYFNTDRKHFGIEVLPDSQTLNLTFAVQEPVAAEFLVGLSATAKSAQR